jgi:hypothetical protein
LKTEAESVEDIVAASNSAVVRDIVSAELKLLPTQKINNPVNKVVRTTPSVESIIPWAIIGLISLYLVSIPPEKRIMLKAIIPMNWASLTLLNCRPRPSLPKSIPTIRKRSNAGNPNLYPVLLTIILTKSSIEKINSAFSIVNNIMYRFVCLRKNHAKVLFFTYILVTIVRFFLLL